LIIENEYYEEFSDYYKKHSTTTIETVGPSILQSIYKKRRFDNTEEVENYSKISQDFGINPIEWWKMHECIYPCLSKFASNVVCIRATGVPRARKSSLKLAYYYSKKIQIIRYFNKKFNVFELNVQIL
jgi:hypothetical protein